MTNDPTQPIVPMNINKIPQEIKDRIAAAYWVIEEDMFDNSEREYSEYVNERRDLQKAAAIGYLIAKENNSLPFDTVVFVPVPVSEPPSEDGWHSIIVAFQGHEYIERACWRSGDSEWGQRRDCFGHITHWLMKTSLPKILKDKEERIRLLEMKADLLDEGCDQRDKRIKELEQLISKMWHHEIRTGYNRLYKKDTNAIYWGAFKKQNNIQ